MYDCDESIHGQTIQLHMAHKRSSVIVRHDASNTYVSMHEVCHATPGEKSYPNSLVIEPKIE